MVKHSNIAIIFLLISFLSDDPLKSFFQDLHGFIGIILENAPCTAVMIDHRDFVLTFVSKSVAYGLKDHLFRAAFKLYGKLQCFIDPLKRLSFTVSHGRQKAQSQSLAFGLTFWGTVLRNSGSMIATEGERLTLISFLCPEELI